MQPWRAITATKGIYYKIWMCQLITINCLDFLISTAVFLKLECKCTGWWSDGLTCQRRGINRSVSFPRSVTGQVFATVRALDTISTSASPSECITLIPETDNWVPNISRNACLLCLCIRKSTFFTVGALWMDGTIFLPSLPLLRLICLLLFIEGTK